MRTIKASEFNARCLKLMDEVAASGEVVEITKHGRPVARLVPTPAGRSSPFGLHRGRGRVLGDIVGPIAELDDWEPDVDQPDLYR